MSESTPIYNRFSTMDHPASSAPNGTSSVNGRSPAQNAKSSIVNSAQSTMDSIKNHPTTQNARDTLHNGPVAQQVKSELANTQAEFQNLANARTRPSQTAATGQPLTHYHSMFSSLLSWNNPRATTIAYLTTVSLIFAARYLPILRYFFKALYLSLGVTAAAEIVGKLAFGHGFASQIRPRRYYTLPKESVDRVMDDIHELLNFFVIETQRLLFADNVGYTLAAFFGSLLSYFLIKFVPLWGLALIGTTVLYLTPLIYLSNQEVIDEQIHRFSHVLNQQAAQVKELAAQNTARATETVKAYAGDYSAKAQEYIGTARQRTASITRDYSAKAKETAGAAKDRTAAATNEYAAKAHNTAVDAKDRTVSGTNYYAGKAQDNLAYAKDRTAETAHDAAGKAQDNLAYAKDRTVDTAHDVSNKARDNAAYAKDRTAEAAHDYSNKARDNAAYAKDRTAEAAHDVSNKAHDNAAYAKDRTAETAHDVSNKARDNAAYAKDRTAETTHDYSNKAHDNLNSTTDRTPLGSYDTPQLPTVPVSEPRPLTDEFVVSEYTVDADGKPILTS